MYLPPRLTIRCAIEDLELENWDSQGPIGDATHHVDHPVVEHAKAIFRPDRDSSLAPVKISDVRPTCYRIKTSRIRGVAYVDADNQVWVIAAGVRKSKDRVDFYQEFMRRCGADPSWWLPTEADYTSLKQDVKANRLLEWRLGLYEQVSSGLEHLGKSQPPVAEGDPSFTIDLDEIIPHLSDHISAVSLPSVSVSLITLGGEEPLGFEVSQGQVFDDRIRDLCLLGVETIAAAIYEGEQAWSKDGLTPKGEPQFVLEFNDEISVGTVLNREHSARPPDWFKPGTTHHYAVEVEGESHIQSVADAIAYGETVFALCGTTFVPRQDHSNLKPCPRCTTVRDLLQIAEAK